MGRLGPSEAEKAQVPTSFRHQRGINEFSASRRPLGPSWATLGRLGCISGRRGCILGPSWALLGPSWPSWRRLGGILDGVGFFGGLCGLSGGRRAGPKPQGEFNISKNRLTFGTPVTPVINQQGAADRRRLQRITAAPCPFGCATVVKHCGQSSAKVLDHVLPRPLWKTFGEMWEGSEDKRAEKGGRRRRRRMRRPLGSLLGHS